jgi:sialate O-acetylesterase
MKTKLFITILVLAFASVVRANVTLPDVVSSSMVLQRDQAAPIWGKADPGEALCQCLKPDS